jgi:hypothetical protein
LFGPRVQFYSGLLLLLSIQHILLIRILVSVVVREEPIEGEVDLGSAVRLLYFKGGFERSRMVRLKGRYRVMKKLSTMFKSMPRVKRVAF